jgi:lipopolysaccharide heptosyltransferase II
MHPMADVGKILVVRLSSIGDIILTTPLLRSLREKYPQARISFLIKKPFADLLTYSPYINELITFDKKEGFRGLRRIKHQLKEQHFDVYLDIHKNWRSRYLRLGLGVKLATTYPKYILRRTLMIWFKINLYQKTNPVYLRYFESVRRLNIHYDGKGTDIHIPSEATVKVKDTLFNLGFRFDRPLVIICPGATYFNKRWKSEGFTEVARYLVHKKSAFIIIHGGKEDTGLCKGIADAIGSGATSLAGKLSLTDSAALLRLSSLVIANDSGLLHLAQSQKRPVVGIYGPTTRELGFFPIEQNSTVVEVSLPCRPCTPKGLNKCPKKHFRCMNDVSAERVIQASLPYVT